MYLRTAFLVAATATTFASTTLASFGVVTTKAKNSITVDTGSTTDPFLFTVNTLNCDITSLKYAGEELQWTGKGSHIEMGLGSATVKYETIGTQYIKITCTTATLTQYMVVKAGEATIYMATDITAEPDIGELRFIARLNSNKLPLSYPFGIVSTTANSTATVEGSDVFVVEGQTRSKFYSSERFIDDAVHCVYRDTDAIHACLLMDSYSYETSAGGPFHRDINTNNGGPSTSLTFYMNSNHVQLEKYRMGMKGPYALSFSRSSIPKGGSSMDTTFFKDLSIPNYVPPSARGTVTGKATGVSSTSQAVLHWYNDAAQYWAYASSASGAFTSPAMKPGTYTQVLYQGEFKVKATSVTVAAGRATTANIAADTEPKTSLWRIGDWDGQPKGFRNADKQLRMHPSDSRMASWGPLTYTVGSSTLDSVPMALVKDLNPFTIKFTAKQKNITPVTLRVGTTLAFAGCRPAVTVNTSFSAPLPAAPTKIASRGFTRGAYRGFGEVYNYAIPAGTLVSGPNTIRISCMSGESGTGFLAPNVILDAIELLE
ncbi:polysaccharide lyase family 4 protein [Bipolaris sorokiniana ND90Pr]|uniref:Rhamnogalacturonate lyase n=1 Tax=Cochliobolus sativus (strain ND90Pr / ATCC 201652) TaxID=665912 RepID=M2T866_COCSN|nr:polysaccharide lyase family 4 protein [Bipolaris sorokiniana ND90Pr]EMD65441.1 polysaccharide lyase family 4 protein [Bipolaris sorokiniana ND90Pr]